MTFQKGNKQGRSWKTGKPSLSSLKKKLWKLVSEWVRRSSSDQGGTCSCYTCGKLMFWKESHAGHAIPGRTNSVLFDTEVIRVQCPPCNIWGGGQYHVFATNLIKENSMEWWEAKLEAARRTVKYTQADIEEMIRTYQGKLQDLT